MKILVVGEGRSELHEKAVASTYREMGYEVATFYWFDHIPRASGVFRHWYALQNKFLVGPLISTINRELIDLVVVEKPDVIFVYRGTHVRPSSLARIKSVLPSSVIAGYNNDNPFSERQPRYLWRYFKACLKHYDVSFAYRPRNVTEFRSYGANNVYLLPPWFIPNNYEPDMDVCLCKRIYKSDVVFIGHYEPDSRVQFLEDIVKNGLDVKIYGPEWDKAVGLNWLKDRQSIASLRGDDYFDALKESKIALCFLSKLNCDVYTRRCFEIPATGTCLVSEYTKELAEMFIEDEEIVFFRTPAELLSKLRLLLEDNALRRKIAANGYRKVHTAGHDIYSRLRFAIDVIDENSESICR